MKRNEIMKIKDVQHLRDVGHLKTQSVAHLRHFALAIVLFLIAGNTFSQSLYLFDVDASNFPTMKAKFYALDKDGNQITNLSPTDFELLENGIMRNIMSVSCPAPKPPKALSSVLTIDISGSMKGYRLSIIKDAATLWVNSIPLGKSECAITSFDNMNYLNQAFTTDHSKLVNAINGLHAKGGTNYDAALINPLAGGLLETKYGKHKKVLVMLTDGEASEPQVSQIVSEANRQKTTIYFVILNMQCPESLKIIANKTGGQCFDYVGTVEQAKQIYQQILQTAQDVVPCEITWNSGTSCNAGITNVELLIKSLNITATTSYHSPNTSIAKLEFNPTTIKFTDPQVGVKVEQKVTVTAQNSNFNVTNITSNNAGFEITPKSFVLNSGQSRELTISYLPADSGYNYCKFDVENDNCPTKYYVSGGWKGVKPKIRTIKLLHPNGDEIFVAGSDTVITWDGVSPDEPVRLEYRINDNKPWIIIADTVSGLRYNWKVPKTPSDNCLARVIANAKPLSYCDNPDVQICNQIWMGCNLDVEYYRNGEPIRYAESILEWEDANDKEEGAWCYYNNDPANGAIFGKLYNWYAVIDPRGLAPDGWHIPTDDEWSNLEKCLGLPSLVGRKIKSTGTIEEGDGLWRSPNDGANNETGFSALPGGYRSYNLDFIDGTTDFGYWWSSTESWEPQENIWISYIAWGRKLGYNNSHLIRDYYIKGFGLSVRCVKD